MVLMRVSLISLFYFLSKDTIEMEVSAKNDSLWMKYAKPEK